jgi:predicted metal-binding membrane protein
MLVLGAITAIEKNLPWGRGISRPLGVILILAAVYAIAA